MELNDGLHIFNGLLQIAVGGISRNGNLIEKGVTDLVKGTAGIFVHQTAAPASNNTSTSLVNCTNDTSAQTVKHVEANTTTNGDRRYFSQNDIKNMNRVKFRLERKFHIPLGTLLYSFCITDYCNKNAIDKISLLWEIVANGRENVSTADIDRVNTIYDCALFINSHPRKKHARGKNEQSH